MISYLLTYSESRFTLSDSTHMQAMAVSARCCPSMIIAWTQCIAGRSATTLDPTSSPDMNIILSGKFKMLSTHVKGRPHKAPMCCQALLLRLSDYGHVNKNFEVEERPQEAATAIPVQTGLRLALSHFAITGPFKPHPCAACSIVLVVPSRRILKSICSRFTCVRSLKRRLCQDESSRLCSSSGSGSGHSQEQTQAPSGNKCTT